MDIPITEHPATSFASPFPLCKLPDLERIWGRGEEQRRLPVTGLARVGSDDALVGDLEEPSVAEPALEVPTLFAAPTIRFEKQNMGTACQGQLCDVFSATSPDPDVATKHIAIICSANLFALLQPHAEHGGIIGHGCRCTNPFLDMC